MPTLKEHLKAGTFPKYLSPQYFDEDAPVPERLLNSSNWMNEGDTLEGPPIYVRYNGAIRPCTNLIYLDQWLQAGGFIVPAPQPAA